MCTHIYELGTKGGVIIYVCMYICVYICYTIHATVVYGLLFLYIFSQKSYLKFITKTKSLNKLFFKIIQDISILLKILEIFVHLYYLGLAIFII